MSNLSLAASEAEVEGKQIPSANKCSWCVMMVGLGGSQSDSHHYLNVTSKKSDKSQPEIHIHY